MDSPSSTLFWKLWYDVIAQTCKVMILIYIFLAAIFTSNFRTSFSFSTTEWVSIDWAVHLFTLNHMTIMWCLRVSTSRGTHRNWLAGEKHYPHDENSKQLCLLCFLVDVFIALCLQLLDVQAHHPIGFVSFLTPSLQLVYTSLIEPANEGHYPLWLFVRFLDENCCVLLMRVCSV